MRDLCESSTFIGVKENVVNVERSGDKRFVVGSGGLYNVRCAAQSGHSPKNLFCRAKLNVNLNLVVLEGNKRKSKTRVAAEPELKWDIESSGFSTTESSTGEVSTVTNHVIVTSLVSGFLGKVVPDVGETRLQ